MLPAVVKKAFRSATVPLKVRSVPVPATVTLPPVVALIMPSATLSVTVSELVSISANGVPVNCKLPATSSFTVKLVGAETVGASLTAVMLVFKVTVAVLPDTPSKPKLKLAGYR